MKNAEIKSLSVDELQEKLAAEQETLQKLAFGHAISPIENPMKIRVSRKTIARLKTQLRAVELTNQKTTK
ncbi:50S ribosomal protein L29 [Rhodocytophaga rosea]|jgi:large subunit ribosomal protein L29|uniref:Large ribosomal subunit protein uL29 n=1 Tax=Rhodocytophaga rosea TaxID=2704465 RepID=A0A6C0GNA4_9BACT|nr:50S ribosomal protein L29 [Rhodocytophaga rosea]QHT69082.1 50S ribosomal protein L29 [Rhodocytophaga rosea]